MFKINDVIFYGMAGVCKVVDITTGTFLKNKRQKFYVLEPLNTENTTIKIPVDSSVVMRKPMSKQEAEALLKRWSELEEIWVENPKERGKILDERIHEGNPEIWARIVKTFQLKKQEYRQRNKKLAVSDGTVEESAKRLLGINFDFRLLKLPRSIQQLVTENKISMGHARPLITLDDEGLAYDIACRIVEEGLSVREVERLVKAAKEKQPKTKGKKSDDYSYVVQVMENKLQTKVKVDTKQIVIKYNGTEDLNRILELIHCIEE